MKGYAAFSLLCVYSWATGPAPGQTSTASAVPQLVRFSGTLQDVRGIQAAGATGIKFGLYADQTGGAPLWTETQNVQTGPGGHYTVLLGSTKPEGLPAGLFASEQAHWVGVTVDGQAEQPRVLLVSAPYALKAGDAETLGGLPPSAFVLAAPAMAAAGEAKAEQAQEVLPDTACAAITSDGTATANQVAKFTGPCAVEPSAIFESGGNVGIGTTAPAATLDVKGTTTVRGTLTMNAKGVSTAAAGANSNPVDLLAASFNSSNSTSINQHFRWQAEAAGNDTAHPSGTLNLLYAPGSGAPAETGLLIGSKGLLSFATGQTFPGTGTITGVTAGAGLTGGGTSGNVNVSLTSACAGGQVLEWSGSAWACSTVGVGTITGVTAGVGLSGGGASGSITLANSGVLAVAGGTGLTSSGGNAPTVSLNTGYTDGRYLQLAGGALGGALSLPANGLTAAGNQLELVGGSVGVGTATPGAPLEVAGSVKVSGAGSGLTFPDGTVQTTAGNPAGALGVNRQQVALLKWFPAYQSSASFTVGSGPDAVAFDGANIWVANYFSNNVTKLLASTGALVGTYSVGGYPDGVAFDGANIWVANSNGTNTVTKLLAATGAGVGTYAVGSDPSGVAFDGVNIWVTNSSSKTVTKLLASTGAVVGTYSVGSGPAAVAFDGANIWVANWMDNTVTKLLAATGALVGTYSVGYSPLGVAFDGANIWVVNYSDNTVTKLLAATGAVVGTYSVGYSPLGVAFDGANIWVVTYSDMTGSGTTVAKLLPSTGAVVGTFSVGQAPAAVAFDGANIWVCNKNSGTAGKL